MKTISIALVLSLALLAACGKSESGGGGGGKPTTVTLAKVGGLKADVPGGSSVGDAVVGDGAMIQGPNLVVMVELASDSRPKTADAAKADADMYSPKNLTAEALADGWVVTFDNEGGMGKNYFAQIRRELGGKSYWCEATVSSATQQQNAVAACKSLRL